MASSKSSVDDLLGESWVDITSVSGSSQGSGVAGGTPGSVTPHLTADEYLRLLREAQRESNQSSARVSLAGSRRDSPRSSPKSPPNSPVQGTPLVVEWQSYYMNTESKDDADLYSDRHFNWIQDWSSRPDQIPPKNWSFKHPKKDILSIRYAKVGDTSVFSKKGLCTLFLTNLVSLILGTGVGLWLSRCGFFNMPSVKFL
ncbi:BNIP3 [Carabus blaptoides fortunei]